MQKKTLGRRTTDIRFTQLRKFYAVFYYLDYSIRSVTRQLHTQQTYIVTLQRKWHQHRVRRGLDPSMDWIWRDDYDPVFN